MRTLTYNKEKLEPLGIFNVQKLNTSCYIFHKEQSTGIIYFGFVRKIPQGGRFRPSGRPNNGAAGTDKKYFGKWTSIGGGGDKSNNNNLKKVIKELNDESGVEERFGCIFDSKAVDLSSINGITSMKNNLGYNLKCHLASTTNNTSVFLFEIEDEDTFFCIFPKDGYTGIELVNGSMGEVDVIRSYSMKEIITLQNQEIQHKNNNYFISYCLTTFNKFIIPTIFEINKSFEKKWINYSINYVNDSNCRVPTENTHAPYRHNKKYLKYNILDSDPYYKKYLIYKNKYLQLCNDLKNTFI